MLRVIGRGLVTLLGLVVFLVLLLIAVRAIRAVLRGWDKSEKKETLQ